MPYDVVILKNCFFFKLFKLRLKFFNKTLRDMSQLKKFGQNNNSFTPLLI